MVDKREQEKFQEFKLVSAVVLFIKQNIIVEAYTSAKYSLKSAHQIPNTCIESFINMIVIINYKSWYQIC